MQPPIPTAAELARARTWAEAAFADPASLPFTFRYDGATSSDLLPAWKRSGDGLNMAFTGPDGLTVRCEGRIYDDYPVVEWTVYLRNDGAAPTPIVSDLCGIESPFEAAGDTLLHHHTGSPCRADDYEPHVTPVTDGGTVRITTNGGRSSNSDFPYFALDLSGPMLLMAIGWTGQWEAGFTRADGNVTVRAKQEDTHFRLMPGEEVRTPRIVLMFADGPRVRAQNMWRRWMIEHIVPREGTGEIPPPLFTPCSSHQYGEMIEADEASQIMFIDRYREEKLDPDFWWMDAGWYPNEWGWPHTGTWEVDTKRFPRGLKPISDHAHERGMRTILWFEPERVTAGTHLYTEHADWLLTNPDDPGGNKLLDLGNPEAREWLTDHIDGILVDNGIDLYRQDFNMEPLPFWRANDADDRRGITENHHVTGLLAYWDELKRRHPGMLIDTCASGGRRNDIEMLNRAVPFLRSDYILEPTGQQGHTYGAAMWMPYFGTGTKGEDEYTARSAMLLNIIGVWDMRRDDLDYDLLRRLIGEWRDYAPLMLGDFYPLTEHHLKNDVWMAWQFDRPDLNRGMVQVFRRQDSPYDRAEFSLNALDPKATYRVRDLDAAEPVTVSGEELIEGLTVEIAERPAARVILYEVV